jgi:hypothetical protein
VGAQAAGEARPDISASDLPPIVLMIARTTALRYPSRPLLGYRYLRLFLDGIRAGNITELPEPPLTFWPSTSRSQRQIR